MIRIVLLVIISFFNFAFSERNVSRNAENVLNSVTYQLPAPSIIGEREWHELQLDRLVTILDRTRTSFGRWGLVQLLHPIADKKELDRRKAIITFLIEHEDEMQDFQKQLERVHEVEKSILAYWDTHDQLSQKAYQFYYSLPGFKELNNNSLALNSSFVMEMFNSWKYLILSLALGGLWGEFQRWLFSNQEELHIGRGLYEGLKNPLKQHSPYASLDDQGRHIVDPYKESYNYKDYMKSFLFGSWRDRFDVMYKGYKIDLSELGLPTKRKITATSDPLGITAFLGASVPTLFFDYQWGLSIYSAAQRIFSMYNTLNALHQRVSDVAHCVDATQQLQEMVSKQAPSLRSYLSDDNVYDRERTDLIKDLLVPRFLKKSPYIYSRGHVLTMHLKLTEKKKSLIPLFHSLAFLDAYCSIAQLYKESQNQPVVFSFAEFVNEENPFLDYREAWLPLLPYTEAIVNDLVMGMPSKPAKIVITGPNGGGKSTILKTLGMAILPQSWCIAPARSARQTIFSSMRTALAPREDLEHGLSTFMAEKKTMAEILADIYRAAPYEHMLVLVDEPYKGTVDAESAKRIYQFGKDVAGFPQALVAIATHVKKPIELAQDTNGIFGNYQVKINEISEGSFERLFKLEPGAAMWWFQDESKRSRFVDWISVKGSLQEGV